MKRTFTRRIGPEVLSEKFNLLIGLKNRSFITTSLSFVLITLTMRIVSLLSMFLVALVVEVEVYGEINIVQTASYGFALVIGMGMTSVPFKYCYRQGILAFSVLRKIAFMLLISTVIWGPILFSVFVWLSNRSNTPFFNNYSTLEVIIFILFSSATMFHNIISNYFRAQQAMLLFASFDLAVHIIGLVVGIIFLIQNKNAFNFLLGKLIVILVATSITWRIIHNNPSNIKYYTQEVLETPSHSQLIAFSFPFLPMALISWGQGFVDRFVVLARLTPSDLGLYAFSSQIFAALFLALGAVNQSIIPSYIHPKNQRQTRRLLLYMTGLGAGLILITFFGVILWLQTGLLKSYQASAVFAIVRSLAILPAAVQMHFVNIIAYQRSRHALLFMAQLAGVLVTFVASMFLVDRFHLYGAAIGSLIGCCASLLVIIVYFIILNSIEKSRISGEVTRNVA